MTALLAAVALALVSFCFGLRHRRPKIDAWPTERFPWDQADWAAHRLADGTYRCEPGRDVVILERAVHVDGVFCQAGTAITFGTKGRLERATLAADGWVEELPLQGGTQVVFDTEARELTEATLRVPTTIGRVPCAAGRVALRVGFHRRQVVEATLSRDCVLWGSLRDSGLIHRIHCRGGTEVLQQPGTLRPHLRRFSPRNEAWAWGLRCAAEQPIDTYTRSGVLADDHVFDHITFPAGSSFTHDREDDGWFPFELEVTLSRSTEFMNHRLPVGAVVRPHRDLVRPPGRLRRWLTSWSAPPPSLEVRRACPWTIGGVRIPAGTTVYVLHDGGFGYTTARAVVHDGVRYPAMSELEHTPCGRIRRWQSGEGDGAEDGPRHPYRAHGA